MNVAHVTPCRLVVGAAIVAVSLPGLATAGKAPPISSVSQYVEQIPTGAGATEAGAGGTHAPLPRAAEEGIRREDATTAEALRKIVSASAYGAPATALPRIRGDADSAGVFDVTSDSASVAGTLSSAVEAVGGGSEERLLVLVAVLLLTTAVAVGAGLRGRR